MNRMGDVVLILLFLLYHRDQIESLSDSERSLFYVWYYLFILIMTLTALNLVIAILVLI